MELTGIRSATELAATQAPPEEREELGKTQFLELMIAQLESQDPLDPAKNEDFIAQLAQFSSVEGIANLNTAVEGMASALQSSLSLQAASLVGREVIAPGEFAQLGASGLAGSIELESATSEVNVDISDASGSLIAQLNLGAQPSGTTRFNWDGLGSDGVAAAPGLYRVTASTLVDGERVALETDLSNTVVGVKLGPRGISAELSGGAEVSTLDIREIR